MKKILLTYFILIACTVFIHGQAAVDIPVTLNDGAGNSQILNFGLDFTATDSIDSALDEFDLPPIPPTGSFDARFVYPYNNFSGEINTWKDYRGVSVSPYTGSTIHRLKYQVGSGASVINIVYNFPTGITVRIQDIISGGIIDQTLSGAGSYQVTNPGSFSALKFVVNYTNYAIPSPGPLFSLSPDSLHFASVAVGTSSQLHVKIKNPGTTNQLNITNIVSSSSDFSFIPNTFPLHVTAGDSLDLTVTFAPSATGSRTGHLSFTHNAAGSPYQYFMDGSGLTAGPVFNIDSTSLTFGTVSVGDSLTRVVSIHNDGYLNNLIIDSIRTITGYSASPVIGNFPVIIASRTSRTFNIKFKPIGGNANGNLIIYHNAAGTTTNLPVTGFGQSQGGILNFSNIFKSRLDKRTYTDTLKLMNYVGGSGLKALQFNMIINDNKRSTDTNLIIFKGLYKGSNVNTADWALEYNIKRGPLTFNGATRDTLFILLYNVTPGAVPSLTTGSYNDLLRFEYDAVDIADPDTQNTSIRILNVTGSLFDGTEAGITSDSIQNINILNRVYWGDVNNDNSVDILDLILDVDHIIGHDSLSGGEFSRADIAPWISGRKNPTPDGLVNVQDLTLLQNIILLGQYPNNEQLNKSALFAGFEKTSSEETKMHFYITKNGISIHVNSLFNIRGMQLEFSNIGVLPSDINISSTLGTGYSFNSGASLRVLLYDRMGVDFVKAGADTYVANIPFTAFSPEDIKIITLILVDTNNKKIENISVEVSNTNSPELPVNYYLSQNYPNPFNPSTTIRFAIPEKNEVKIKIYNALGQKINELLPGVVERGSYSIRWDGKDMSGKQAVSGVYIYKMESGNFVQSKKMLLIK